MAQDTDTDLTPPGAVTPQPHVRVFGRREEPFAERSYRAFALEIEGKRPGEDHESRWDEPFQCFTDVDGGMWVAMGNARTELQVAQAVVRFMGTNLRDDDGVSLDWSAPPFPEVADPDDPESDWLRGEPSEAEPDGEPLYRAWDGELYTRADFPSLHEMRDGSSRRRFVFISDSMDMRYRLEALQEVSNWLTEGITGVPTRRPAPSGHGPQRTGRGAGAKRR